MCNGAQINSRAHRNSKSGNKCKDRAFQSDLKCAEALLSWFSGTYIDRRGRVSFSFKVPSNHFTIVNQNPTQNDNLSKPLYWRLSHNEETRRTSTSSTSPRFSNPKDAGDSPSSLAPARIASALHPKCDCKKGGKCIRQRIREQTLGSYAALVITSAA